MLKSKTKKNQIYIYIYKNPSQLELTRHASDPRYEIEITPILKKLEKIMNLNLFTNSMLNDKIKKIINFLKKKP